MNLDRDPEFLLNSDPNPGLYHHALKKNLKINNNYREKQFSLKKGIFQYFKKSSVESLNGEFMSSILHILLPIHPTFTASKVVIRGPEN